MDKEVQRSVAYLLTTQKYMSVKIRIWIFLIGTQEDPIIEKHIALVKEAELPMVPFVGVDLMLTSGRSTIPKSDLVFGPQLKLSLKQGDITFYVDRKRIMVTHDMTFAGIEKLDRAISELVENYGFDISGSR